MNETKRIFNILLAFDNQPGAGSNTESLRNFFNQSGLFQVGEMDMVAGDADSVGKAISSNAYDVLICKEMLNKKPIGAGTIKAWKKLNENVRIILIVGNDKKAGDKLRSLYVASYYDALYLMDFAQPNNNELSRIILNGRSAEEAVAYYDLKYNVRFMQDYNARNAAVTEQASVMQPNMNLNMNAPQQLEMPINGMPYEKTTAGAASNAPAQPGPDMQVKQNAPFFEQPNPNPTQDTYMDDVYRIYGGPSGNVEEYAEPVHPMNHAANRENIPSEYPTGDNASQPEQAWANRKDAAPRENVRQTAASPDIYGAASQPVQVQPQQRQQMPEPRYMASPVPCSPFKVAESSIVSKEGYIVSVLSDSAIIVEVPGAHFLHDRKQLIGAEANLIMQRLYRDMM